MIDPNVPEAAAPLLDVFHDESCRAARDIQSHARWRQCEEELFEAVRTAEFRLSSFTADLRGFDELSPYVITLLKGCEKYIRDVVVAYDNASRAFCPDENIANDNVYAATRDLAEWVFQHRVCPHFGLDITEVDQPRCRAVLAGAVTAALNAIERNGEPAEWLDRERNAGPKSNPVSVAQNAATRSDFINAALRKIGMSQHFFCQRAGLDPHTLKRYCLGMGIAPESRKKISAALKRESSLTHLDVTDLPD
jgi:hypothetical protein